MITLDRAPTSRVALAIALSLIAHLLALAAFQSASGSRGGDSPLATRIDAVLAPPVAAVSPRSPEPVHDRTAVPVARRPPAVPLGRREPIAPPVVAPVPAVATDAAPLTRGAVPEPSEIESVEQYRLALILVARRLQASTDAAIHAVGRVTVGIALGAGGMLREARIVRSSGDAAVDAAARAMLVEAHARMPIPAALVGREVEFAVTVEFGRARRDGG